MAQARAAPLPNVAPPSVALPPLVLTPGSAVLDAEERHRPRFN